MDYESIDRLNKVLDIKIKKTRSDIRMIYTIKHKMTASRNGIRTLEWVLEYTTQKKVHIGKLEDIVQDKIAELKMSIDKATHREVTDFLFTKIGTLRWVLYVIHSINRGCPAERRIVLEDSLPTRKFYD